MNRRIVAELPGWGVLASLTAGSVPGWRDLDEQALKRAAAAMMVRQGLLSVEEAGVAQLSIQPPSSH